jgi:hypothetical protein
MSDDDLQEPIILRHHMPSLISLRGILKMSNHVDLPLDSREGKMTHFITIKFFPFFSGKSPCQTNDMAEE